LPDATQLVLALAAAEDTGDLAIVLRAADRLELTPEALEPGEQAELVQIDGATITFRHPLARSAVYAGATALRRQRIHAALAEVLTAEEHSDRRVWHQALATVTPDEEVAAALEASARRARARAAPASAATAWLRAAGLSTDEGRRGQRLAAAGQAAWDAGQLDRTREVLAQALPTATGEVRARLLHLRGVLEWRAGTLDDAYPALIEGANLTADPTLEIEMLFDAADVAALSGELDRIVALGPRVKEIPALTALDRCRQLLLSGFAQLSAGDVDAARALFAQGLEAAGELDDPRTLLWASQAASAAGDLGSGLPYAARAVQLARTKGRFSLVQIALHRYAASLFADSQFEAAYATAQEAYRLSLDSGAQLIGGHLTTMAAVEAAWGREQEAFAHAEQALGMARQRGAGSLEETAEWALGFIDLSGGRYDAAADRLLRITGASRPETSPLIWGRTVADAVEAATRSDRHTEAVERLTWFRAWVELAPTDRRRAILARCEALLDPRASAGAFSEALELADALPAFQRARTELLYGEWLRRERRRQEARSHLRRARELFYGLRAVPWEKRAEAELRATGETTRARNPSTLDQLTPQELQIGGLVAQGLTNREVAAQLYLSPRTVDYHLRKVFSKLGIASRIELVRNGLPPREHA
jgi:DNA-binding CsgD family transcriptional regulator